LKHTREKKRHAKFIGRTAKALSVMLVLMVLGGWGLYHASQQMPDFYAEALVVGAEQQQNAGYVLEQEVLDLHTDLQQLPTWEAFFSEAELNGWLAADLPRKFPSFLPAEIDAPRVNLEKGQLKLACRYRSGGLATVVHLTVFVHMADEPNTVAIRLSKARAGALPLPLKSFLDHVTDLARRLSLPLRWTQQSGDPVALLTFPSEFKAFKNRIVELTVVEVLEEQIRLGGHARNRDAEESGTTTTDGRQGPARR
jgi:hypothetical protein